MAMNGCDMLLLQVGKSRWELCSVLVDYRPPSPQGFLGGLAMILPTLPSCSVVDGDINIDLRKTFSKLSILATAMKMDLSTDIIVFVTVMW